MRTSLNRGARAFAIFVSSAASLGASKGRRPVTNSKRTTPNENTSDLASTSIPSACSGDMYGIVPIRPPASVFREEPVSLATPKSVIFTSPSSVSIKLLVFTSRWTIPRA